MAVEINKDGIEITNRFFDAVDSIILREELKGFNGFTDRHHLKRGNLYHLKTHAANCILKPELMHLLVMEHNVDAEWLITGVGPMFQDAQKRKIRHEPLD